MERTTIAAIATPAGYGGIGIIKISGPEAVRAATAIFRKKSAFPEPHKSGWIPESRHFYYGHVIDAENRLIDEAMLVAMPAPTSYTGEDVVEIQAHAGPLALKSILNLLLEQGVCLAEPGEFTRRAFLNGRIDLTQAEAVMDLIHARSTASASLAMQQLSGRFKSQLQAIKMALVDLIAALEAGIDFPEDVDGDLSFHEIAANLEKALLEPVRDLLQRHEDHNWLREGLRVVIAGPPNAGKSSLLNCLVDRDRSIVTDLPGTTRDLVEDHFVLNGIPVVVTDTAGIREKPDLIEQLGMEKALERIEAADLILLVLDIHQALKSAHFDFIKQFEHKSILIVLNKMDLSENLILPSAWENFPSIRVAAKYNRQIDQLKKMLAAFTGASENRINEVVPNIRHKQALEKILSALEGARTALFENQPAEIIIIDLNESLSGIQEILGDAVRPDILDRIFERFCIGK